MSSWNTPYGIDLAGLVRAQDDVYKFQQQYKERQNLPAIKELQASYLRGNDVEKEQALTALQKLSPASAMALADWQLKREQAEELKLGNQEKRDEIKYRNAEAMRKIGLEELNGVQNMLTQARDNPELLPSVLADPKAGKYIVEYYKRINPSVQGDSAAIQSEIAKNPQASIRDLLEQVKLSKSVFEDSRFIKGTGDYFEALNKMVASGKMTEPQALDELQKYFDSLRKQKEKPLAQTQVYIGKDGSIGLTKEATNRAEEKMMKATEQLGLLEEIRSTWSPYMNDIKWQTAERVVNVLDRSVFPGLSDILGTDGITKWNSKLDEYGTAYIKEMTGTAMGAAEATRLMSALRLTKNTTASAFKKAIDDIMIATDAAYRVSARQIKEGLSEDPKKYYREEIPRARRRYYFDETAIKTDEASMLDAIKENGVLGVKKEGSDVGRTAEDILKYIMGQKDYYKTRGLDDDSAGLLAVDDAINKIYFKAQAVNDWKSVEIRNKVINDLRSELSKNKPAGGAKK